MNTELGDVFVLPDDKEVRDQLQRKLKIPDDWDSHKDFGGVAAETRGSFDDWYFLRVLNELIVRGRVNPETLMTELKYVADASFDLQKYLQALSDVRVLLQRTVVRT